MKKTPFSRFIELITFDQTLVALEKELEKLECAVEQEQTALEALDHEIDKERALLHDMRKEVDAQELQMQTLHEQAQGIQERSAQASSGKEYQAFKKELEQIRQVQHEQEEVLVASWNACEHSQKLFETRERTLKEKKAALIQEMDLHHQTKIKLLDQIAALEDERKIYVQDVPEDWVEKYTRMRTLVSNPVVPVLSGMCGGCSYLLTTQVMLALAKNKMMQCGSCYRLMYKNFEQEQAVV